jgi:hypothetical protein
MPALIFDDAFEVGLDVLLNPDLPFDAYYPGEVEGGGVGLSGFPWWQPFYVWRQPEDFSKVDWDKINGIIKSFKKTPKKKKIKFQTAPKIAIHTPKLAVAPRVNLSAIVPKAAIGPRKLPFRLRGLLAELRARTEAIRETRARIAYQNRLIILDML